MMIFSREEFPVSYKCDESNHDLWKFGYIFKRTGCHQVNAPCFTRIKIVLSPSLSLAIADKTFSFNMVLLIFPCGSYTSSIFIPGREIRNCFPLVALTWYSFRLIFLPFH